MTKHEVRMETSGHGVSAKFRGVCRTCLAVSDWFPAAGIVSGWAADHGDQAAAEEEGTAACDGCGSREPHDALACWGYR